jgi:hypothetical protein
MIDVVLAGSAVAVLLLAACVLGGWRIRRGGRRGRRIGHRWISRALVRAPAAARAPGKPVGRVGRRVEARLVARLMAGDLTAAEYRDAMALLAADDAVRHPVVVPEG